jgi:hypothetical protein
MSGKWAAYKAKQWQWATIVKGTNRVHFCDTGVYAENYLAALDHMIFFSRIAKRDGWRIVRGA